MIAYWIIYIVFKVFDSRLNLINPELIPELVLLSGLIISYSVAVSKFLPVRYEKLCFISFIMYSSWVMYKWIHLYNGLAILLVSLMLISGICAFIFKLWIKVGSGMSVLFSKSIGISLLIGTGVFIISFFTIYIAHYLI